MLSYIAILFFAVSIILSVIAIVLIVKTFNKLTNYNRCTGIIKDIMVRHPYIVDIRDNRTILNPIVSFEVSNKLIEVEAMCYAFDFKIGDTVSLLYNKDDLNEVYVDKNIFLAPTILGCISILLSALGFSFLYFEGI